MSNSCDKTDNDKIKVYGDNLPLLIFCQEVI